MDLVHSHCSSNQSRAWQAERGVCTCSGLSEAGWLVLFKSYEWLWYLEPCVLCCISDSTTARLISFSAAGFSAMWTLRVDGIAAMDGTDHCYTQRPWVFLSIGAIEATFCLSPWKTKAWWSYGQAGGAVSSLRFDQIILSYLVFHFCNNDGICCSDFAT